MRSFLPVIVVLLSLASLPAWSQGRGYPPDFDDATEHVYKEVDGVELKLWEFSPDPETGGEARPAIVFFFGGGWKAGSPAQFAPHSRDLGERGMVAFVADYRVASRHGTPAKECVADARDAIRFVRANAEKLGVDPDRIAAGGGSAGGHIAACLGVIGADEASHVDALALFNPACVLAPIDGKKPWPEDRSEELRRRMGVDPEALSPAHHVSEGAPPCVIFHGTDDEAVPFDTARTFAERMTEAGASCVLHAYSGEGHGFFNFSRKPKDGGEAAYDRTVAQLDAFFVDLGWLAGE